MDSRFVLNASGDQFSFNLKAENDETILTSERYESLSRALVALEAVRENAVLDARYDRRAYDSRVAYFVLRAGNDEVIGTSGIYSSAIARERAISAVKRSAPAAALDEPT